MNQLRRYLPGDAWLLIAALLIFNGLVFFYAFPDEACLVGAPDIWIGNWKLAQFFASYDHEFLKRGLIATLFTTTNTAVNHSSIALVSAVAINGFIIAFFQYSRTAFKGNEQYLFPFLALFILSPGVAMQMGADFARFDPLNMLITLIIMSMISFGNNAPTTRSIGKVCSVAVLLIAVLLIVGLLIHEAFLFINVPLILAICLQKVHAGRMARSELALYILVILVTIACIMIFGGATMETTLAMWNSVAELAPDYNAQLALDVWHRSLLDNVWSSAGALLKPSLIMYMLIASIPLLGYTLLLGFVLDRSAVSREYLPILFSPLGVAPLFLVGLDHSRWIGLMILLLFLVFLVLLQNNKIRLPRLKPIYLVALVPYTAFCLFLGPMGVDNKPFPQRNQLVNILQSCQML